MLRSLLSSIILFQSLILAGQQSDFSTKGNDLIQASIQESQCVGIAAGFSVGGQMKWQEGAGFTNLDSKMEFGASTVTRIASIAKPMTAIAVMQLVELGKLDLDKPIQTYLPTFPKKKEGDITTRHLLKHASGIGEYKNNKERENRINYPTLADAVAVFKDRDLISTPGQAFNYTTYGYVVLGLIIEKVSGMSYESYMQKNIWDKAQMVDTGIEYHNKVIPSQSAIYHRNSKGKISKGEPTNLSDRIPGGGIYSTVSDMLKFGDAVLNNTFIQASTLDLMIENQNLKQEGNGYGLGWYLYGKNPKYGNVFGHNGGQTGASTFLMLLPEQKTTVVVLSNTSGAMQRVSNIAIKLFDVAAESSN